MSDAFVTQSHGSVVETSGLREAMLGEQVVLPGGGAGVVVALRESSTAVAVLTPGAVAAGAALAGTGALLRVPVGAALRSRVVDPLGRPLDGRPPVETDVHRHPRALPLPARESRAAGAAFGSGIKWLDVLGPPRFGQRVAFLGPAGTGKSDLLRTAAMACAAQGRACFIALPGPRDEVDAWSRALHRGGAYRHATLVVPARGSPAGAHELAPFTAMAMAAHVRDAGRDALVLIDDLDAHADALRSLIADLHGGAPVLEAELLARQASLLAAAGARAGGGSLTLLCAGRAASLDFDRVWRTDRERFDARVRPALSLPRITTKLARDVPRPLAEAVGRLRLELTRHAELRSQASRPVDPAPAPEAPPPGERAGAEPPQPAPAPPGERAGAESLLRDALEHRAVAMLLQPASTPIHAAGLAALLGCRTLLESLEPDRIPDFAARVCRQAGASAVAAPLELGRQVMREMDAERAHYTCPRCHRWLESLHFDGNRNGSFRELLECRGCGAILAREVDYEWTYGLGGEEVVAERLMAPAEAAALLARWEPRAHPALTGVGVDPASSETGAHPGVDRASSEPRAHLAAVDDLELAVDAEVGDAQAQAARELTRRRLANSEHARILELLEHPRPGVRLATMQALQLAPATLPDAVVAATVPALRETDPAARRVAAAILRLAQRPEPALVALLDAPEPSVSAIAAEVLAAWLAQRRSRRTAWSRLRRGGAARPRAFDLAYPQLVRHLREPRTDTGALALELLEECARQGRAYARAIREELARQGVARDRRTERLFRR